MPAGDAETGQGQPLGPEFGWVGVGVAGDAVEEAAVAVAKPARAAEVLGEVVAGSGEDEDAPRPEDAAGFV